MPGGSKFWRWKYRIGGKENRYAMFSYPELSLKEALEETEAARKLVKHSKSDLIESSPAKSMPTRFKPSPKNGLR